MTVLWILVLFVLGCSFGMLSAYGWFLRHKQERVRDFAFAVAMGTLSTACLIGAGYIWGGM